MMLAGLAFYACVTAVAYLAYARLSQPGPDASKVTDSSVHHATQAPNPVIGNTVEVSTSVRPATEEQQLCYMAVMPHVGRFG